MPNATELCTTADLKTLLGITSSNQDSLLALVKANVEEFAKTYTARDLLVPSSNYVEYYDGDGEAILRLNQRPIVSIASIYADPARLFEAASLIPAADIISDDVQQRNGYVELYSYRFLKGRKAIKVTYSAGYATVPADLSYAVKLIVAKQFKVAEKKLFAEGTQRVGDITTVLSQDDFPKDAMRILDSYRRVADF